MKGIVGSCFGLACLAIAGSASALNVNTTNDCTALASSLLAAGSSITITSCSYTGAAVASGTYSDGPMGVADGAVLTSGSALNALPPNDSPATSTPNGLPGDPLCDQIIGFGFTSQDATRLTITFDLAPGFDGISFQSVFGSEEYPEWVGTPFNDVYGAFLNGTSIEDQIVFDDMGNPITINGPFFSGGAVVFPPANGTEYDGSTGILTTQAPAVGGSTGNVLHIVICDAGDTILDSGVFLSGLTGCVGDDCSGTVPCHLVDNDADGVNSCDDCNDADPTIFPGAAESCNDVDDDCDAEVDEGNVCCVDSDADGLCDEDDPCPADADNDADGDGVCGDEDRCPGTVLPEGVPTGKLGVNHWADVDGDGVFDTTKPKGKGPAKSYTIQDTGGCSCEQIIDALGLGAGHKKHGCSISAMDDWLTHVGP